MWTFQITDPTHKIVQITLTKPSPYDPKVAPQYKMYYQGWTWASCSCASLWYWGRIPERHCNEETLAEFLKMLLNELTPTISSWDPHRVFAQVPMHGYDEETKESNGRVPFFELLMGNVYPGVEPVYQFRNRSHESTMQRLFDLDTDQMAAWLEKYNEKQQTKPAEAPAAVSIPNTGTIISPILNNLPAQTVGAVKLNNGGQRPLAPGEYFTR